MRTNNVLVLGPPHSGKIRIAQHITKDLDTSTLQPESHSGLIYNYQLNTKYFSSNVNLLIEEYPDSRDSHASPVASLQSFYTELKSPEYSELRDALDGLVFTVDFARHSDIFSDLLDIFIQIKSLLEDNDIFSVVVSCNDSLSKSTVDMVEDEVISHGFEFVNFSEEGTNEYREKLGKDRLVEIFQSHEWSQTENPISDETYTKHKTDKLGPMAESLIANEADETTDQRLSRVDLDILFAKLKFDKQRAEGMSQEEKKSFVEDLVDNYMEYF
ncbi:hypothetical protein JCM33374_g697 [Metschnikowia sp. JCM 33374]|nr:hypothetical protein JCM33374_g697 [Metschnikowia sp. JCM 33374]